MKQLITCNKTLKTALKVPINKKVCLFEHLLLFVGVLCWFLFWYVLLFVLSSLAIIFTRKREPVALLLLSFECLITVNVLWLFSMVPWAGLQCVIVVCPDHTHLLLA